MGGVLRRRRRLLSHIDPARPLQTLVLPGIKPPAVADRFTWSERNVLLGAGVGTFRVDDGGLVRIERAVSTYITNAYGVADPSWRDSKPRRPSPGIRYQRRARVASKFATSWPRTAPAPAPARRSSPLRSSAPTASPNSANGKRSASSRTSTVDRQLHRRARCQRPQPGQRAAAGRHRQPAPSFRRPRPIRPLMGELDA